MRDDYYYYLQNINMKKPIVFFEDVSYSYGKQLVIDQVSFNLEPSTITTLIGPNGAGKTTIAKLLLGITKAKYGKVISAANKISYAPQNIKLNSNLPMTAKSFLNYISPRYEASPLKEDLLNFTNFQAICDKDIITLSGGQRQRLVLAGAILQSAELLVLDEPTQSLDITGQQDFYKILEKIRFSLGSTIFIISHDLFTVMKNSDQVLCLNHHICCKGTPTHTVIKGIDGVSFYSHQHNHKHSE